MSDLPTSSDPSALGDDRPRPPRPPRPGGAGERPARPPRPIDADAELRPRRPRPDGPPVGDAKRPGRPRPVASDGAPAAERARQPRPDEPAPGSPRTVGPPDAGPPPEADRRAHSRVATKRANPPLRRSGADPWRGRPEGADWTSDEWTSPRGPERDELPAGSWAGQSARADELARETAPHATAGDWTGWSRGPAPVIDDEFDSPAKRPLPVAPTVTRVDPDATARSSSDESWDDDGWDDDGWDGDDDWDDGWGYPPGEYVRLPRRGGWAIRLGIVLLVLVVGGAGVLLWAARWVDGQVNPAGGAGPEVALTIDEGMTTNQIAEELNTLGVIDNSTVFRYYLRCPSGLSFVLGCDDPVNDSFQAGEYALNENMGYDEIVAVLRLGPIPPTFFDINVPEGLTLEQIRAKLVEENGQFSAAEIDAAIQLARSDFEALEFNGFQFLEGLLFPATYEVDEDSITDEAELIDRMLDEMENRFAAAETDVGRDPVIDELLLTDYEILIIASMIEEEARLDVDRPKIARVIYNRLLVSEALGIDAVARYAGLDPADREADSPYNTRGNVGLPPTPIAAPGQASIEAALAPEAGDWFYYVLTNEGGVDGAHRFVVTEAEFAEGVAVCTELGLGCG